MANILENWSRTVAKNQEEAAALVQKLFDVARPQAVFSEPVTVGEQVVITASEVNAAMGIGFGGGVGSSAQQDEEQPREGENEGAGGGGGGGGASFARPVAAIVVSPQGVWVEPIVDVTKLGLAMFTVLGSMLMFWSRMRRASRS
jgi:uncharacterized spore protein YtfJ